MNIKYDFDEIIDREGTNSLKYELRREYFGEENLQPMWVADMDFATPAFIRDAVIKRAVHPIYGYSVRPESYYTAITKWLWKRFGWEINNEFISSSPGVVPALNICVQTYTKPGDGIIVQTPVYFPFFTAIKGNNRKLLYNQLIEKENRYSIDFKDFETKAKKASMFILCHPHNPVGRVWDEAELREMIKICLENNVLIISDEIHCDIVLNGNRHIPLASVSHEAAINSITCISPSKTFNLAGLSTSVVIIHDKKLKARYDRVINTSHIGMGNLFGTVALETAYNYGEDWLEQLILYLETNFRYLNDFIDSRIPEITCTPLQATYLAWLDFRKLGLNNRELKKLLYSKARIGLSDGETFGPGGEGFQRINIAVPAIKLKEALLKLESAVADFR